MVNSSGRSRRGQKIKEIRVFIRNALSPWSNRLVQHGFLTLLNFPFFLSQHNKFRKPSAFFWVKEYPLHWLWATTPQNFLACNLGVHLNKSISSNWVKVLSMKEIWVQTKLMIEVFLFYLKRSSDSFLYLFIYLFLRYSL